MILRFFILMISAATLIGCNNTSPVSKVKKPGKDEMEALNRYFIQKDRELIQNYAERKRMRMTESPTGLWYWIIKQGEGNFLTDKSRITLEYECSLLDGTLCYSSEKDGPKEIVLGKTKIEPGLNEGLRMLRPGAEAVFILTPLLAYGLPGDGNKIPPRSVIVYHVNIN